MYELKKDISTPSAYFRAGEQRTKEEWEKEFPDCFAFHSNEWFIDLTEKTKPAREVDELWKIVNEVFDKMELRSISYKNAAKKCIELYIKKKESLLPTDTEMIRASDKYVIQYRLQSSSIDRIRELQQGNSFRAGMRCVINKDYLKGREENAKKINNI